MMPSRGSSSRERARNAEERAVIGFEDEAKNLLEKLSGGKLQLEVVSIVGMPGLGKTTLATKVYNDPLVVYRFDIRGWTNVSQVYTTRNLFQSLWISAFKIDERDVSSMSDEMLRGGLYKRLKGIRYLIVLDDIWDIDAWNSLKGSFPNDKEGSRIMLTTRLTDVATRIIPDSPPYFLRFLKKDESWDLLQWKVFKGECCPQELEDIGHLIAEKCQGVPLAVVVIAGLLAKTNKTVDWWKQVSESVSSYIASDPEQYMETLALSYNHLPDHLKPCFLYFAAFPEDYDVSVWKLIGLWVAEGFIQTNGQKSLEDLGQEYLLDLIDRNLVLVAKERSGGGIKACRVHDLLHDLCSRKAKECHFLQQIRDDIEVSPFCSGLEQSTSSLTFNPLRMTKEAILPKPICESEQAQSSNLTENKVLRLSVRSPISKFLCSRTSAPSVCSILCFAFDRLSSGDAFFIFQSFKFLRVMDLWSINVDFDEKIAQKFSEQLIFLRFLALRFNGPLPESISRLFNLEYLILQSIRGTIPWAIWKMVNLRHLCINSRINDVEIPSLEATLANDTDPLILNNLQCIKYVRPSKAFQDILKRTPNLRQLKFLGPFDSQSGAILFPDVHLLHHLEMLKLAIYPAPRDLSTQQFKFPPNLRKLTLSHTVMKWEEINILGMLPNLEVLKLRFNAFVGKCWETSDGGFRRLKFLKLLVMTKFVHWVASSDHFPVLEHLIVDQCKNLKEIPSDLGYINTLKMIEVYSSSPSAADSARKILIDQQDNGNDGLKVIVIER